MTPPREMNTGVLLADLGRFRSSLIAGVRALEERARDRRWRRFEPTAAAMTQEDAEALRELLRLLPAGDR